MGGGPYSHPTMMASFFLVVVLFVCLLLFFFTNFVCPLLYYLHVHDMIRFINVLSWGEKKIKKNSVLSKGTFDVVRKSYLLGFFYKHTMSLEYEALEIKILGND